jgi:hypothetical protein
MPQIEIILERLGKHIEIKMGIPGMGALTGSGSGKNTPPPKGLADKPPKLSEFFAFAEGFNRSR